MIWMYAGFVTLVLLLLALDLGVFHRKAHVISVKEALGWSAFWIALGLAFVGFIYVGYENHWLGLGLTPDRCPWPRWMWRGSGPSTTTARRPRSSTSPGTWSRSRWPSTTSS